MLDWTLPNAWVVLQANLEHAWVKQCSTLYSKKNKKKSNILEMGVTTSIANYSTLWTASTANYSTLWSTSVAGCSLQRMMCKPLRHGDNTCVAVRMLVRHV